METEIIVDIFYGDKENCEQFSAKFYFDTYEKAKNFIKEYVEENSNCNARIIEYFYFTNNEE